MGTAPSAAQAGGTHNGHGGDAVHLTLTRLPEPDLAQVELLDLTALTGTEQPDPVDIVDEWGMQSFPASDPPANW
jgi:hypothetical protein